MSKNNHNNNSGINSGSSSAVDVAGRANPFDDDADDLEEGDEVADQLAGCAARRPRTLATGAAVGSRADDGGDSCSGGDEMSSPGDGPELPSPSSREKTNFFSRYNPKKVS